ncbi:TetR family transcriptional regulator [Nocardia asteroides]|uniref:TetR family transcriptional regulator n=1 Tax=Nocardia asteroides TaxID=1824 RepID=UPI00344161BF
MLREGVFVGRSGREVSLPKVERPLDRITFPVIAERAGVAPTTLYRRWDDVNALLGDVAVGALTRDGDEVPDLGSLEADLAFWSEAIRADVI